MLICFTYTEVLFLNLGLRVFSVNLWHRHSSSLKEGKEKKIKDYYKGTTEENRKVYRAKGHKNDEGTSCIFSKCRWNLDKTKFRCSSFTVRWLAYCKRCTTKLNLIVILKRPLPQCWADILRKLPTRTEWNFKLTIELSFLSLLHFQSLTQAVSSAFRLKTGQIVDT